MRGEPTTPEPHDSPAESIQPTSQALVLVRGVVGGAIGGLVGYFVFRWLLTKGFYALVLPGAFLGLGAGLAAQRRSLPVAIMAASAALALGIYAEWSHAPFRDNGSLLYFVTHLHQLDGGVVKYVMMGLGVACAYWFGQGR